MSELEESSQMFAFGITVFDAGTSSLRFFDITPLGQILNRFSADTNIIDQVNR